MSRIHNDKVAYGKSQALIDIFNPPIVAQRAPNVNDKGPIGQLWDDTSTNSVYMLTSYAAGVPVWSRLDNAGVTGITWVSTAANPVAAAINSGYILTAPGAININLPAIAPIGSEIYIETTQLWNGAAGETITITAAAGDTIVYGAATTGAGGTATWQQNAPGVYLTVHLICVVADSMWHIQPNNYIPALV